MKKIDISSLPKTIDTGLWDAGHIQGIAFDTDMRYVYYSYTTVLVKADLDGNIIGYVGGLTGHLGCIDFNDDDGKLYGTIEYKHDAIGQGIMNSTGIALPDEDAFYVAIFDVDKINRLNMDAEKDGIMKTVYLPDVIDDYSAVVGDNKHRFGCSGIDGIGFGPVFGYPKNSPSMLMVAYGIYGDNSRIDNDYQVYLCFDWRKFDEFARPLVQNEHHHSGTFAESRYFLFTGNTVWGTQNLEYDAYTGDWIVTVYCGKKPQYPNRPMYMIDGSTPSERQVLRGVEPRTKENVIFLKKKGIYDESNEIYAWDFPYGQTGIYSIGNGYFYFSEDKSMPLDGGVKRIYTSTLKLYRYTGILPYGFEPA